MIHSLFAVAAVVSTIAGVPGTSGYLDGGANVALFNKPTQIALDRSTIYVVDRINKAVRKIDGGAVSTFTVANLSPRFDFDGPIGGGIVVEPNGGAFDVPGYARKVLVASSGLHAIVQPDVYGQLPATHDYNFVGQPGTAGFVNGAAPDARFNTPTALAIDRRRFPTTCCPAHDIYIADTGNGAIRKLRRMTNIEDEYGAFTVTTIATGFVAPRGLAFGPDGSLYVADAGLHTIIRVMPDGASFAVAGKPLSPGNADGVPGMLNTPTGLDVDDAGNVYIADTGNSTIRRLRADGVLETVAGSPGEAGFVDGDSLIARFNGPVGIQVAADGKSLIVADTSNHVIRKITFTAPPAEPRRRTVRH